MDNELRKKENKKYEVWQPFLLSIMMAIGILLGYKMNDNPDRLISSLESENKIEIGRIEEILRLIEIRYVDKVDRDVLIKNAVNGILATLDPHSLYLEKADVEELNDDMEGNFKGIGIESHMHNDTAVIIKVINNSPAATAGLKQFDKIIKVNNKNVAGRKLALDSIRYYMRMNGDVVNLEILQHATKKNLIKNIKPTEISIPTADISFKINDTTGYIQIKHFSSNTYNEFMKAFEELVDKQKIKNLIIDLRNNPGGYLPQATKIVNQLIKEKKKLIVSTRDKSGKSEEYFTSGHSFFQIDKIAILVDENSASGSEVIAGAIQDHDRGIIIGTPTYGKGLVQEQFNLSNGAALRLTTAKYYTPSGRSIQKDYVYEGKDSSIKKETPKVYKTLLLNRNVLSNSGIIPDVELEKDTNSSDAYSQIILRNKILDFLLSKYQQKLFMKSTAFDYDALTKEFIKYQKHKNLPQLNIEQIQMALKEEIQYLASNGDVKTLSINQSKDDEYIKAALRYFKGEINLKK
jgi:carboxyl-terminal processing protease